MTETWQADAADDDFDRQLRAIAIPSPPEDLFERCLNTIGPAQTGPAQTSPAVAKPAPEPAPQLARRSRRWAFRLAAIAAGVAIVISGVWVAPGERNLLAEVYRAMDEAAAYHIRWTTHASGAPAENEAINDVWVVAGAGSRQESTVGGKLVSVVVDNLRWRLTWDPSAKEVIAWPSKAVFPLGGTAFQSGMFSDRETLLAWAKKHKKSIVREQESLNGQLVDKLTLQGIPEGSQNSQIVWFDPATRRPLKCRFESPKPAHTIEATIDYPPAASIPAERFSLPVPRDARIEINDPAFGRQIYSKGASGLDLRQP